jgi:hypothetical protein
MVHVISELLGAYISVKRRKLGCFYYLNYKITYKGCLQRGVLIGQNINLSTLDLQWLSEFNYIFLSFVAL